MGNTMKQETVQILDEFVSTANKFISMAKEVAQGASEAEVCSKYGIDRSKFRRLVRTNWYINSDELYTSDNVKYNSSKYFSWKDMFLDDLLGKYSMELHVNFDENYQVALDNLDKRARDVIDKYYRLGLTQQEIAEEMGVSQERVRQIRSKGINQLRHPSMLDLFSKGKSAVGL